MSDMMRETALAEIGALNRALHEEDFGDARAAIDKLEAFLKVLPRTVVSERAEKRRYFIKQNAGRLLHGLLATCDSESELPEARKVAIEQAGLLFDEIEAL